MNFFSKFFGKKKKADEIVVKREPEIYSNVFRTQFAVLESALARWEKYNSHDAPVWLNYHDVEDAKAVEKELRKEYKIIHTQRLGAVVIVSDKDITRLVNIINRMERERNLQLDIYKAAYMWQREHENSLKSEIFSFRFKTEGDARITRRLLRNNYGINNIQLDNRNISMSVPSMQQFCTSFEEENLYHYCEI